MKKIFIHILEIGCSGLFGVLLTIGYQHFSTQPQVQQQNQIQQDQEQQQLQNIVLNINGKEVSYGTKDVEELNNKIFELESENSKLESDNELLNEKIKDLNTIPDVKIGDYKLIIDGIEKNINNNHSIIEYDKHIYIRDDIVLSINSDINVDRKSNKIVVGSIFGETYLLMKACPPYQTSDGQYYREPETIEMAGKTYTNGFIMQDGSYALFNLDGKYTSLDFILGHIDGATMRDGTFNLYLDDILSETIKIGCDDIPQTYSIPLNNAIQMKIEKVDDTPTAQWRDWYGFANMILQ